MLLFFWYYSTSSLRKFNIFLTGCGDLKCLILHCMAAKMQIFVHQHELNTSSHKNPWHCGGAGIFHALNADPIIYI